MTAQSIAPLRSSVLRPWSPARLGFALAGSLLLALLALPVLALLLRAVESDLLAQLQSPMVFPAIRLSLVTTGVSVALTLLTGTPLAYVLAHRHSRRHRLMDTIVDLPVVLPPSVAGLALLMAFGRRGIVGGALADIGIALPFTTLAVVLAQTFVAAPFYVRAARVAFGGVERDLEEIALVEGASEWQVFVHVMLPLARRGLASGLILCWARALGEFGATIMFAGNLIGRTQTMPLAIYIGLESDLGAALALSAALIAISFGLLVALRWVTSADVRME
jgi:molybdate transport system permease protein